jgi:hypothetical protein
VIKKEWWDMSEAERQAYAHFHVAQHMRGRTSAQVTAEVEDEGRKAAEAEASRRWGCGAARFRQGLREVGCWTLDAESHMFVEWLGTGPTWEEAFEEAERHG